MAQLKEYPAVHSVAQRPNMGPLPSLIEDARSSQPVLTQSEGVVYFKDAAFVYTDKHGMAIPDLANRADAPGVADVPTSLLVSTFRVAQAAVETFISETNSIRVDIGWNNSHIERRKRIASQPDNLHLHVVGFEPGDLVTLNQADVMKDPILRSKLREPMDPVLADTLQGQVLPAVPEYSNYLTPDPKDRFGFSLKGGLETISEPGFAQMIQKLHINGQQAYDALAACFFDPEDQSVDAYGRKIPQSAGTRIARVMDYLTNKPEFSASSSRKLVALAGMANSFEDLVNRKVEDKTSDNDIKNLLYTQGALQGFAYSMVLSGEVNANRQVEDWSFRFHPVVFSSQDILQASSTPVLFERNEDEALSPEQYSKLMSLKQAVYQKFA